MERDLTLTQASQAMGVSVVTLRRLIHAGKLEAYTVNPDAQRPSYRIKADVLEAYRDRSRVTNVSQP